MTLLGKGILVIGETSGIGFGVAQALRMALPSKFYTAC
jgi:NAD(P)-dependent dehydrogenase (short-subunit alcohol dehydrogenase family)